MQTTNLRMRTNKMNKTTKSKKLTKEELYARIHTMIKEKEGLLESVEKKCEEYLDGWKRTLAEFDNYRKRKEKEEENLKKYAKENILYELLGIIDNFERVLLHIKKTNSLSIDSLREGIEMVYQQLQSFLDQHHVKRIKTIGERFDPNWHEAVEIEEGNESPHYIVIEEMLPGYTIHEKLLRPTKVKVATQKNEKGSNQKEGEK